MAHGATPFALATCGANNLNGYAYGYNVPNGVCQDGGIRLARA